MIDISKALGRISTMGVIALVGVTFLQVVLRYLGALSFLEPVRSFLNPILLQDLEWQLFALIFLLGMAITLQKKGHVSVDVLVERQSETQKRWIKIMGFFLLMVPFCLWVIWVTAPFVWQSFETLEGSPNPGGMKFWFIVKGFVVLGFIALLWEGGRSLRSS